MFACLVCSSRLDENSIIYGRTGIMPGSESASSCVPLENKISQINQSEATTSSIATTVNSTLSSKHLAPPKVSSTFGIMSGENMRSLSPAEQARIRYIFISTIYHRLTLKLGFVFCTCTISHGASQFI